MGCGWLRRIGLHKGSFFNWITSYRRVHTRMPTFFPIDLLAAGPPSATYGTAAPATENVERPPCRTTTRKMPFERHRCRSSTDTDVLRANLLAVFDTGGVPWRRDKKRKGGGRGSFFRGTYWNEIIVYQTTRLHFQFLI